MKIGTVSTGFSFKENNVIFQSMIVGIPKEVKIYENRVGMAPQAVGELVRAGLEVVVEHDAGLGSGYSDRDYRQNGAKIVNSKKEVYRRADLILKVKEPQASEYSLLRPGLILFAFLHLAAAPHLLRVLLKKKVTAIAFETVEGPHHHLPLLAPMSEIAGSLAALIGARYLQKGLGKELGGKGVLLNAIGGGRPGRVTVIGAGRVGSNAIRLAHGLGALVTVYDIDQEKLMRLRSLYPERLEGSSDLTALPSLLTATDLLIGAVLIPGKRAPHLITRKMIQGMEPGSVVVDVAVDQGGCVETIHPTTLKTPVYKKYNVLHYGVTNIPSLVPRTATEALTQVILPYVLKMGTLGIDKALASDTGLMKGLNTRSGQITYPGLLFHS